MDPTSSPTFGDLLRRYRLAAGLTQEELAERAQVSPRAISDLERGARNRPWRETTQLLATALKLDAAERAQLEAAARPPSAAFPDVRGRDQPSEAASLRANLPASLVSLVGRKSDRVWLEDLLRRDDVRLVTLTGPGGIGKTSLALAVAAELVAEFGDGVGFVSLESVEDARLVPSTIAQTLGLREVVGRPAWESLSEQLRHRRLLLVLDNFEQLLDAAPDLTPFLGACPKVKPLVTSRSPLHLPGEQEYLVPPLGLPGSNVEMSAREVEQWAAVQLFVRRAQAVKTSFILTDANASSVAAICQRLDGIPLAIELAAALVKALPLDVIAERLANQFRILGRPDRRGQPRQQTLRATFDWSYNLLTEPEQVLFRRVAVFAGGFTLEAAEAVCGESNGGIPRDDVLDRVIQLVDQSLVVLEERAGGARYRLLVPLRQYGWERLVGAGEADAMRDRHRDWCLTVAAPAEAAEDYGTRESVRLDRIAAEHDNLRAALAWCLDRDTELGLCLAGDLHRFWQVRGYDREMRQWLSALLAKGGGNSPIRADALWDAAINAWDEGDFTTAAVRAQECLDVSQAIGDEAREIKALGALGTVSLDQGDYERARSLLEECERLGRAASDDKLISWPLCFRARLACYQGDYQEARAIGEDHLATNRRFGGGVADAIALLGWITALAGDVGRGRELLEEGVAFLRTLGDKPGIGWSLAYLGYLVGSAGDYQQADTLLRESLLLVQEVGHRPRIARSLCFVGILAIRQGDPARGARILGAAGAVHALYSFSLALGERTARDASVADAKASLGADAFARSFAEGRAMTVDEAVAFATNVRSR